MACINAIKDFCTYLWDLPEATKEFRTNLAKLDASTKQYGYNTKDTNKQMKELYGYFADEQVCVNAITNLQGLKLSQSELKTTTNACIAVWTSYGDSIPIESLTESVNETSQVGKVTGSLADALNWAGINEDKFNEKLAKCKTTQERAKLVTDTLNKAYGQSKKAFDDNTQSVQKLRQAEYDLQLREAELAKSIDPLKTKFIELKSKGLQVVIDVIPKLTKGFQDLKTWLGEVAKKCKEAYDNTISQMTELIAQNYNHPSICFWGIGNELTIGGFSEGAAGNLYATGSSTLNISGGEKITTVIPVESFEYKDGEELFLMSATKDGMVKKTPLAEYDTSRRDGIIAINLEEGDELIGVQLTDGKQDIILVTADGQSIRFNEEEARPMARATKGVRGIKLLEGDHVVAMEVARDDAQLLVVTENGYGKRKNVTITILGNRSHRSQQVSRLASQTNTRSAFSGCPNDWLSPTNVILDAYGIG